MYSVHFHELLLNTASFAEYKVHTSVLGNNLFRNFLIKKPLQNTDKPVVKIIVNRFQLLLNNSASPIGSKLLI
jgi:hypothetical protein